MPRSLSLLGMTQRKRLGLYDQPFEIGVGKCCASYQQSGTKRRIIDRHAFRQKIIDTGLQGLGDTHQRCQIRLTTAQDIIAIASLCQTCAASHLGIRQAKSFCPRTEIFSELHHRYKMFLTVPTALCMFRTYQSRHYGVSIFELVISGALP